MATMTNGLTVGDAVRVRGIAGPKMVITRIRWDSDSQADVADTVRFGGLDSIREPFPIEILESAPVEREVSSS